MKEQLIKSIRALLGSTRRVNTKTYYILNYTAGEIICRKSDCKSDILSTMDIGALQTIESELMEAVYA